MKRTVSFSGTFSSAVPESPPQGPRYAFLCGPAVLTALCLAALVISAGAWAFFNHQQSMRSMQADMLAMQATLSKLSVAVHNQSLEQKAQISKLQAELTASLPPAMYTQVSALLIPKLEALEKVIATKASTEQILSRLSLPFTQIQGKLSRLERAHQPNPAAASHASSSRSTAPPSAGQHAEGEAGMVQITFAYSPKLPTADIAALYWLGKHTQDGKQEEIKYTEIPSGMRVVETTRPGDCWLARHAKTGAVLLEKRCATIEATQEVVFG